jgi:hypothetical protein
LLLMTPFPLDLVFVVAGVVAVVVASDLAVGLDGLCILPLLSVLAVGFHYSHLFNDIQSPFTRSILYGDSI